MVIVTLLLAGCGGGGTKDVPENAVAVVGKVEISKADFNQLMDQAKRSYKQQKREFPKAGTPEYTNLRNQAMKFLVQRAEFSQEAPDLGVKVDDKKVDERLGQIKKQYFSNNEKKYKQQLAQQHLTETQVKADIRASLTSEEIFKSVTDDVKVKDADIAKYYNEHKDQYGQPESRDVRHILVKTKKQADDIYDQLKSGADFAALAKKYSIDPGSKNQGGKLTISKGQTVAPFDQTAFLLDKNKISRPVKTQYGYHIIQPISDVKPAKTTPLKDVKEAIRQQLLQEKKNDAMQKWLKDLEKSYEKKTAYAVGYAPPKTATTGTTTG
jgi:parvulin-like peptidyl-prolyl isomerase